jgi:hypothetical protein
MRQILCFIFLTLLLSGVQQAHALVLYGANGAGGNPNTHLFILNPANGSVVTDIGPTNTAGGLNVAITGLAFDPATGVLYGSTSGKSANLPEHLVTIDPATGMVTDVGATGLGGPVADITIDPTTGTLYGWLEPSSDDLVILNKLTGVAMVVGNSGLDTYGSGLAANAAGTLFFTGTGETYFDDAPPGLSNNDYGVLHTINKATGLPTAVAALSGDTGGDLPINALAFDEDGTLYGSRIHGFGGGNPATLITINTTTGAITQKGFSVDNLDAIAFQPQVIPEPSTIMLVGVGFAALVVACRRRKK